MRRGMAGCVGLALLFAGLAARAASPLESHKGAMAAVPKITAALPEKATAKPAKPRRLLVTIIPGHGSCFIAAKAFELLGQKTGAFEAVATDDLAMFEADKLNEFDAVVMNNNSGRPFQPRDLGKLPKEEQEAARKREETLLKNLQDFVKSGKGVLGIHGAADSYMGDYNAMIGAHFAGNPWSEKVPVRLDDPKHPLCAVFEGKDFEIADEIYQFKDATMRQKFHILFSLDIANLKKPPQKPEDYSRFPLAWVQSWGQGRVLYCALGHRDEIFWNPAMLRFYLDALQFVLGDLPADMTPSERPAEKPAEAK